MDCKNIIHPSDFSKMDKVEMINEYKKLVNNFTI